MINKKIYHEKNPYVYVRYDDDTRFFLTRKD